MSTTFDFNESSPEWDAVIEAIEPVHRRREPTIDDLLDLRNEIIAERDRLNASDDARVGVLRCLYMLDNLLSSL